MRVSFVWVVAFLSASVLSGCAGRVVTTRSLLSEMTDLGRMAEYPEPAYTCRQFSSYDRKSVSPEDDEGWFANRDAGQFLRTEERGDRTEHVMMDAAGPGAIVRIWSANPKGVLRIYLDGSATPAVEAPMADVLGGKLPGIPGPIAGQRGRGWNSYFPIPYAEHCKVTTDQGGSYYHINYRTYTGPWTKVVSYRPGDLETLADEVAAVAARLASPRTGGGETPGPDDAMVLEPGAEFGGPLADGAGRAIVGLRARVWADDVDAALRSLVLTIETDGQRTVACPLGDFFGAAPGVNPYESLPMGVTDDGEMWSHWVMPYRDSATVRVRNTGDRTVRLWLRHTTQPYQWTNRSMHFHAGWKTEIDAPTMPKRDWNYATIRGRGVFAGASFSIANPVRNWWGEGDEKIYVDGEEFPSHFGTGTEDYYGYAWCCNERFAHAYHNQPRCDGPGNYGHTSVNRWHILDRIPFERDFRFDMELWHWHTKTNVTMSVVSYWYARPGATSDHGPIRSEDLRLVTLPAYEPSRVAGAIEGESLRIIEQTGTPAPQEIVGCSGDRHLWWREAEVGDRLVLAFDAPSAGRYRVLARFVKAVDYGLIRMSVNGESAGGPVDFYNNGIALSKEMDLGTFTLSAGENRLAAEIVGANEKAVKKYMFGLDYLRLEPSP